MADVAVGMQALVTVVGRYHAQTTMNTYPYIVTAVTGTVELFTAIGGLNTALLAGGSLFQTQRGCCPENWENVENWIQVIRPVRYRKTTFIGAGIGLFAGDGDTANLQASIERYSQETGRHEQGGVRIPIGTNASAINAGFITPALKAALEEHAEQMILQHAVGGVTWTPITGVVAEGWTPLRVFRTNVKDTVRVVRRRTVGLGI